MHQLLARRHLLKTAAVSALAGAGATLLSACGGAAASTASESSAATVVSTAPATQPSAAPTAVQSAVSTATATRTAASTAISSATSAASTAVQPKATTGPVTTAPTSVTFMEPGSLQGTVDFQAVVAAFAPKHPEIKVHFEPSAQTGLQGSYDEQLVTLMAGGTGPDVFKTEYPGFASFATSGAYLDLDPYVARDATVDLNGFFSEHLAASKYQGKLYALPVDGAPIAMFYNVDAYKEAGLALPTWDTTWEQALSAAQQLTKRDQTGQALSLGLDRPPWLPWVWSNGGDLFDAAGKTCLLDRPEAIAALQWIQDATVKYKVAPTAADLAKAKNGSEDLFTQAHLNTFFVNRGVLGTLSTLKSFHFDAAPIPQGPKGRMSQLAVGWTSVWSGSKQPQGAYTLLAYVTSDEGETVRMTHVFAAFPSRKALTQQSWYKDYKAPMAASTGIDTVFADTLLRGEARGWPENPKMPQVTQAINKQFAALYDGSKAAAAAVNAVLSS